MSWKGYVDDQLMGQANFGSAAIVGLDGSIWAESEKFPKLSAEEAVALANKMSNVNNLGESGILVGGLKYIYISGENDKICRGKLKEVGGVLVSKTGQALIIGICGDDNAIMTNCSERVEKLGDYLRDHGF